MFVLDTNVVSELRKVAAGKADARVTDWARATSPGLMFLSSITIQELEHGVLLAERADPPQGSVLRRWLDDNVRAVFEHRVLPVDAAVARRAAALHVPDPAPFRDALIGATALVHGMRMVTRNVKDFERFQGLTIVNPWERGLMV
jgi:toxin FitB